MITRMLTDFSSKYEEDLCLSQIIEAVEMTRVTQVCQRGDPAHEPRESSVGKHRALAVPLAAFKSP